MLFDIAAETSVIINGKIVTFKAGALEVTDKPTIEILSKCKKVSTVKAKSKK